MVELEALRARGSRSLVLFGWLWGVALVALLLAHQSPQTLPVAMLAIAVNLLPTASLRGGIHRQSAKYLIAISFAVQPAIAVFALSGLQIQMDAHLYFLVALASLAILYDWRPIALASALILFHHILVIAVAPLWAFEGTVNLSRLAIHALAVILEGAALATVARRVSASMVDLASARLTSEEMVEAAQQSRLAAEMALMAAASAENRARDMRRLQEVSDHNARASRRTHLAAIAGAFEVSVTDMMAAVSAAAHQLAASAKALQVRARDTDAQACGVAAVAAETAFTSDIVANHFAVLAEAIGSIATSADEQGYLSEHALNISLAGHDAVLALSARASQIGHFTVAISDLASTINLVALNASIEAARSGDAGLGFAVVADEVKTLARRAGTASREIGGLTEAIRDRAMVAEDALRSVGDVAGKTVLASTSLRQAVSVQLKSSAEIERNTSDLATCADHLAQKVALVAGSADATRLLSDEVEIAATSLLENASALHRSTQHFVEQLQAAQVESGAS